MWWVYVLFINAMIMFITILVYFKTNNKWFNKFGYHILPIGIVSNSVFWLGLDNGIIMFFGFLIGIIVLIPILMATTCYLKKKKGERYVSSINPSKKEYAFIVFAVGFLVIVGWFREDYIIVAFGLSLMCISTFIKFFICRSPKPNVI